MQDRARKTLTLAIVTLLFLGICAAVAVWARPAWIQKKIDLGMKLVGLNKDVPGDNDMTCYIMVEPTCYEMPAPEQDDTGEDEADEVDIRLLLVTVASDTELTGIEVTCPSGFRSRSPLDPEGRVAFQGVPDEPCDLRFLGETAARFRPVSAGQAVSCTVDGTSATCSVIEEPDPAPSSESQ